MATNEELRAEANLIHKTAGVIIGLIDETNLRAGKILTEDEEHQIYLHNYIIKSLMIKQKCILLILQDRGVL